MSDEVAVSSDPSLRLSLFRLGNFALHSGQTSAWKIDCDALTDEDWKAVALMFSEILPPFGRILGVETGGLKFAAAMTPYKTRGAPLLIVDDVLTTGRSMEEVRNGREAIGAVVFARGQCPAWVTPLFQLTTHEHKGSAMAEEQATETNPISAQEASGGFNCESHPACGAGDPLTDATCQLSAGHPGTHWGHGPYRTWDGEAVEGA